MIDLTDEDIKRFYYSHEKKFDVATYFLGGCFLGWLATTILPMFLLIGVFYLSAFAVAFELVNSRGRR